MHLRRDIQLDLAVAYQFGELTELLKVVLRESVELKIDVRIDQHVAHCETPYRLSSDRKRSFRVVEICPA